MCLFIKGLTRRQLDLFKMLDELPEPKIAKKDIVCYKIMRQSSHRLVLNSLIRGFPYAIGREHIGNLVADRHKYKKTIGVEAGFHSYIRKEHAGDGQVLVKCRIPKGAKYYTGTWGDRVSNRIIIDKII